MIQSQKLSDHLLWFCRTLRKRNFLISMKEVEDGLRALQSIDISDREQFRIALKIVFCSSREEQEKFNQAFQEFFLNGDGDGNGKDLLPFLSAEKRTDSHDYSEKIERKNDGKSESRHVADFEKAATASLATGVVAEDAVPEDTSDEQDDMAVWTATNAIRKEVQEIHVSVSSNNFVSMEKAAEIFARQINLKQSRRYHVQKKKTKPDLRRTLRQSVQTGGYPIKPVWTGPKKQNAAFILLCDSSRSMSSYADTFLQFAYALSKRTHHVEVFLFSTKLRRVTKQFAGCKRGDFPLFAVRGNEWGGGTCIGESLYAFGAQYGMQLLRKNTIVLIASDGLDAGDIDNLERAMKIIYMRASSVIWLNPLLNIDGYQPKARGMKRALPYIDVFSKAFDAASFSKLANTLKIRR